MRASLEELEQVYPPARVEAAFGGMRAGGGEVPAVASCCDCYRFTIGEPPSSARVYLASRPLERRPQKLEPHHPRCPRLRSTTWLNDAIARDAARTTRTRLALLQLLPGGATE